MKQIITTKANSLGKKFFLSVLVAGFLTSPLQAYEGMNGLSSSVNAGFRLSIPFGAPKQTEDKVKFGLQMSLRREFNNNNSFRNDGHMTGTNIYNADIMSLNFSENGFKSVSFVGQDTIIYQDGRFRAAGSSEDEGGMSGLTMGLLIGAGVVLLGIGAVVIVACEHASCTGE